MADKYGANQYKQTAVMTANRGQVLIMLYEAAIRNIKRAAEAIDNNNVAEKGKFIVKTHDIINELLNSLNFEVGGQIAKDLERLYNYIGEELLKANLENNKKPLQNAQKILETLLSGWRVAVDQVQKESANKGAENKTPENRTSDK